MTLERISRRFIEKHPLDAVRIVEQLTDAEKTDLIISLDPAFAADLLQTMPPADAVSVITLMTPAQSLSILQELSSNFSAGCLRRLPAEMRSRILNEAERAGGLKNIRTLLQFPSGVVGSVMDPDTAAIQEQMTARETTLFAKRHPEKLRNIIYVVNEENALTGKIEVRDLLLLNDNTLIRTCMKQVMYKLNGRTTLEAAGDNAGWDHVDIMPVVDYHGIYLGSLSRETFLQALTEIDTNDYYGDQPKEILIGLAETFLNTCSELLFPNRK